MDKATSQELIPATTGGALVSARRPASTPEEIRQEIEASRRQIASSLDMLQHEVRSTMDRALDWRQWVHDHPQKAVGIAFGVGLYFALR
ncbi:DUF3618 domain-containing protein [Bradymonadaceae bacterium TMQ3]|uniref:DUF3618 domain-containing protein n=1 Tax=Lujinxingia sediminis TaxID=2480984 RepID=A0ABY0CPC8_9DELT|nr:DUF883 C-terminal domain-containing protein [Lujinxingia sediminis]RDV38021.1 DUF3618 domain-containing protein [Bradymonadaceae bacterium TMQ3]RVU42309.1 DUF3618 domain-containing protein [Lujinxingia sediminis]TXC75692.1 DUF3618 domain-containing protein [Bradymonadales bacterium TMQ1]